MKRSPSSPWHSRAFRTLFTATAFSQLGTNIGYVAVPLIAVSALDAGPGQVGALAALSTTAFLLIGLPAGVWLDRMRRRRVLMAADLVRAVLLASIPFAWWLDALTLTQLYAVVLLNGCATVFFDVGSQSFLPEIVGHDGLVPANAAVVSLTATTNVAGRGAGGFLVQLLAAPLALLCTSAAYLASAVVLTGTPRAGRPVVRRTEGRRLFADVVEGLRHVFGSRELRALAFTATLSNLGSQMINAMLPVLFIRELRLSAGALGLFWAAGGLGVLLGAVCARPLARHAGFGRALGLAGLWFAPAEILVGLVGRGPWLWLAGAGWLAVMTKTGINNVLAVSLRQRLTPNRLLGRMNATFRFLLTGALAIGSVLGGLMGELISVRSAVWAGAACLVSAFLPVLCSPITRLHELPEPVEPPGRRGPSPVS